MGLVSVILASVSGFLTGLIVGLVSGLALYSWAIKDSLKYGFIVFDNKKYKIECEDEDGQACAEAPEA